MKKFLSLMLAMVMALSLIACGAKEEPAPAAKEETKTEAPAAKEEAKEEAPAENDFTISLKYGHGNTTDNSNHRWTQTWADSVAEATDGRITITIYPAGQLGSLVEMQEAVELGTLDMTMGDTSILSNIVPAYGLCSLPFLVDSYDTAAKIYDGEIAASMAEAVVQQNNIRVLGYYWNGFRQMVVPKEITTIEDCKGIKMRSPEVNLYMDMFNLLEMKPTPIPWGETYTAVESGVVDGMETTTESACIGGFYKLTGNVVNSNHMISVNCPMINEDVWQSIPAEDQQLMLDLMAEAVAGQRAEAAANEAGFLETMAAEANVTTFEDPAALIELFTPYWSEYAETNNCVEQFEQIMALK